MYCPVCFNDTLKLKGSGVVQLIVNDKQMDAGRFLFNLNMDPQEIVTQYSHKLEDFFKWYSNFKNQEPIQKVQLLSSDIVCDSGCRLPLSIRVSVVDLLVSSKNIKKVLDDLAKKYSMTIELIEVA